MVDMSATLIHHGHIRLLKKAAQLGDVIVGLTTDDEIQNKKKYIPELSFEHRCEILEAIKYVKKVVPTPWLIDESILDKHQIDLLIHGDDNSNLIPKNRLQILPRTEGISSSDLRYAAWQSITDKNNQKLMLTPGPAVVLFENLEHIKPLFGRGDKEYDKMAQKVTEWIKKLSGQDELIISQGSATFSLELAARSFVSGKVLIISTGVYSDRFEKFLSKKCHITICQYDEIDNITDKFDWVMCVYTETSTAFKSDLTKVYNKANELGAKLFTDATGSIGLEDNHHLADVLAFSSCKGLFGLTGASFIAYKKNLTPKKLKHFYFNMETHTNKMVTGPYHAIASLYGVMKKHHIFKQRVINSKNTILKKYHELVRSTNQPLLCTYLEGKIEARVGNVVLYTPRSNLTGSVLCHFGEIHTDTINITNRIKIKC